ncbi:hypothetical protein [Streptosporangium sp. G12]
MTWRRFCVLVNGMSPEMSLWRRVVANEPIELTGEDARSFIHTL